MHGRCGNQGFLGADTMQVTGRGKCCGVEGVLLLPAIAENHGGGEEIDQREGQRAPAFGAIWPGCQMTNPASLPQPGPDVIPP